MIRSELKDRFCTLIPEPRPGDWELEEHLEALAGLTAGQQDLILGQVPVIWPVSHALCYSYLACATAALACLDSTQVGQWVAALLDVYERQGLRAAQQFMADVENNFLCRVRGEAGLTLNEAAPRLETYARSIVDRKIILTAGPGVDTDTATIFLPRELTVFRAAEADFLLYKLIVTFQLGLMLCRTYDFALAPDHPTAVAILKAYGAGRPAKRLGLEDFFALFPEARLAEDLFTLAEGWRVNTYLAANFAGLWRDSQPLRAALAARRPAPPAGKPGLPDKSRLVEALSYLVMAGAAGPRLRAGDQPIFDRILAMFTEPGLGSTDSTAKAAAIYAILAELPAPYQPVAPVFYLGRLQPAAARHVILQRRTAAREKFVKALAVLLLQVEQLQAGQPEQKSVVPLAAAGQEGAALLIAPLKKEEADQTMAGRPGIRFLTVAGHDLEMPEPLRALAAAIVADLGQLPAEYVAAAQGLAGRAAPPARDTGEAPGTAAGQALVAPLSYDEWDFRRSGFRKDWCRLYEKRLLPVKGTFVEKTLEKHRGLLRRLKKQFEMLRRRERFVKRQRDGDDIDFDALVEALADTRAGRPAAEGLFIQLRRDERDIAAVFLVDMSSSTEGWVSQALKEALILMGQALAVLGDRFAIYGFSGMRRLRADFYHIKDLDEPYNDEVKGRIAAIAPQEYTRMGPPLRHAAKMLQDVDARVRLLITLSDGKPEDYDDYKGEYAIEDTRHALIEAKAAGIHPFCITIDRQAHDYIAHMYGEVNYIFLDDVRQLPARLPEIYRLLTT